MNRLFKITFLSLFLLCANLSEGFAQADHVEQHTEVVMRMIGHELLLSSDDSTTRVMPISKAGGMYKISFEKPFGFLPDSLSSTINRVISKSGISAHYIVEVMSCESGNVAYGYEVGSTTDSTFMPCAIRSYPEDCYSILITLLDAKNHNDAILAANGTSEHVSVDSAAITMSDIALWTGLILVLVAFGFYFLRKRRNQPNDPNIINLGKYHFDKLKSELLFENQRIELSGKEADLLILLYDTVNTTVEREVILKLIWGDNGDYIGRTLDVFVSKLRKKLESDPRVKIVNIRGVGYKLVMDGRG